MKPIVLVNPGGVFGWDKDVRALVEAEGYIVLEVARDDAVRMLDPNAIPTTEETITLTSGTTSSGVPCS